MQDDKPHSYSISVRLRRTITEYCYIRVPVTDDIMQIGEAGAVVTDEKGQARIDPEKMADQAVQLARLPSVVWYREAEQIQPHPLQKKPEPDEKWST